MKQSLAKYDKTLKGLEIQGINVDDYETSEEEVEVEILKTESDEDEEEDFNDFQETLIDEKKEDNDPYATLNLNTKTNKENKKTP